MIVQPSNLRPEDLASALHVSVDDLWGLARAIHGKADAFYKPTRKERTKKGKFREIDEPKPFLKALQRRKHNFIQQYLPAHKMAHGGVCGRSCFTSARTHKGCKYLIQRDIKACYPSIPTLALYRRLKRLGFWANTARLLSLLLTVRDRVPQGSPTSSDALNLYLWDADQSILSLCGRWRCKASRVYDDFVISTDDPASVATITRTIEREIAEHELDVNEEKRRRSGFRSPSKQQRVHNLEVKSPKGVGIPRDQWRVAIEAAESYVRTARCVSPYTLEVAARKRQKLTGYMGYCGQADYGPVKHLRRLLKQGDRLVHTRLLREGITRKNKWWVISRKRNEPRRLERLWRKSGDIPISPKGSA